MAIVIKVSKPGFDVKTATDKELAFSSDFIHPKLYTAGKISGTDESLNHPFGHAPSTAGYILTSGKYFVQYDLSPFAGYQFENTVYGKISTDSNVINLSVGVADRLIYLLFADPATPTPVSTSKIASGGYGWKMSETGVGVREAYDRQLSLASNFMALNIVQQGEITVSRPAGGPFTTVVEDSGFSDVTHDLGYPAHLILFNEQERGGLGYFPGPIGLVPGMTLINTEVYIDSSKIRFRVSRYAWGTPFPTASFFAVTLKIKYFLTNFRLPT